jgi:hypothetical protein
MEEVMHQNERERHTHTHTHREREREREREEYLSGMNFVGSSHISGSLWIANVFTRRIVPLGMGMWNPRTLQSLEDSRGTRRGTAGYRRSVSKIMDRRYGSFGRSVATSKRLAYACINLITSFLHHFRVV